jgi:hypothetical protein
MNSVGTTGMLIDTKKKKEKKISLIVVCFLFVVSFIFKEHFRMWNGVENELFVVN